MFENEKTDLKDCNVNKKSDGKFGIILKDMLDSVVFSLFISCLLITDTVLLALIGIIYQWQIFLAIVFFIEPILRLVALGFKHFSVIEWVVYEFLIPTMNVVAVALNYFDYYYLDVIYAIRLIRIISVHGIIFDYIKRILGNYARFGASLVLAIAFLIILSSLSLQIFCGIPTLADSTVTVLGCHFFSNTIMMSIFITFILANLELTEEEIKEMQKEIKISFDPLDDYAGRSIETQVVRLSDNLTEDFVLPLRFKIYKKFKNSPPPALVPIQFRKSNFPNVNKNFMAAYLSEDYPVYEERLYVMENIRPEPDAMKKYSHSYAER
ncbi:hypothetical protein MXB_3644 [Myxobolus squamalis]|nr:hypothetical protein MXB_3644 [Myxobolus squamalis]